MMLMMGRNIIVCFLLAGCMSTRPGSEIQLSKSSFSPFIITKSEAACIDTTYIVTGTFTTILTHEILKIDGYIYEVRFSISVDESYSVWSEPFYVIVDISPERSESILFNENHDKLISVMLYDYIFTLKSGKGITIRMTVGYTDEYGQLKVDRENPFQSKLLKLN